MGKATNSIARKGSRGKFPLAGCRDSVPAGVWGNAPTVSRATNSKGTANKGAGSEASLPVTLRVLRRAPKLLFPSTQHCRAKWARPTSMGEDFLSLLVFFVAGVSPLRRRQGGFPIAPLTPSAPPRLGLSATRFVRSKRFLCQSAILPDYKTPAAIGQIVRICCRGCAMLLENALTPARTANYTVPRRSRLFAAAPRACRIR